MFIIIFLTLLLLFFITPDIYIYATYLRQAPMVWRVLFFLPTTVSLFSIVGVYFRGSSSVYTIIFLVILFCIAMPKLFFMVFSLIAKLLGIWSLKASTVATVMGMVAACAVSLAALYGLTIGWKRLEIKEVELSFDTLPEAFDGYRIVHLSDLHVGTYGKNPRFLQRVVDSVNATNADLIVFTGDLVNMEPEEIAPFQKELAQLTASDGIVAVLGNHDYCLYGNRDRWSNVREGGLRVAEEERALGWKVLMNESVVIRRDSDQIAIAGVENTGKPPFPQIGNLKETVNGITSYDTNTCDKDIFTILLSHDPSHWRMEVLPKTHIPLTLSGHTHAAQVKIGKWSPSSWMYNEWGGLYQSDGQQLFISEGLGGTLPFRFGATPQIIILTLHKR